MFVKGQSGNPAGRPKRDLAFRDELRNYFDSDEGRGVVMDKIRSPGPDQMRAIELALAYAYGKPTQPLGGEDGQAIPIRVIYEDGPPPETP